MTPDEFAAEKLAGRIAPEEDYQEGGWSTAVASAFIERPTCAWVLYLPSRVPAWPHLRPCGRPATTTGTYEDNRGRLTEQPRCADHEASS